jgi:hypothetical protein
MTATVFPRPSSEEPPGLCELVEVRGRLAQCLYELGDGLYELPEGLGDVAQVLFKSVASFGSPVPLVFAATQPNAGKAIQPYRHAAQLFDCAHWKTWVARPAPLVMSVRFFVLSVPSDTGKSRPVAISVAHAPLMGPAAGSPWQAVLTAAVPQ